MILFCRRVESWHQSFAHSKMDGAKFSGRRRKQLQAPDGVSGPSPTHLIAFTLGQVRPELIPAHAFTAKFHTTKILPARWASRPWSRWAPTTCEDWIGEEKKGTTSRAKWEPSTHVIFSLSLNRGVQARRKLRQPCECTHAVRPGLNRV